MAVAGVEQRDRPLTVLHVRIGGVPALQISSYGLARSDDVGGGAVWCIRPRDRKGPDPHVVDVGHIHAFTVARCQNASSSSSMISLSRDPRISFVEDRMGRMFFAKYDAMTTLPR